MLDSNLTAQRTLSIRDLKGYLGKQQVSPEKLAREAQLSHMTVRRWLKRKDEELIPEKYYPILAPILARPAPKDEQRSPFPHQSFNVDSLMEEIEKSGQQFKDVKTLEAFVSTKLKSARVDFIFTTYCKKLIAAIRSPKTSLKKKAIAVGALIYFISPIDLIPDHIPVVGYLDDLAVLSLAVNSIASSDETDEAPVDKRVIKI
jgi:uncharacterized membrane protein YkvA (DUF1232 family)